MIKDGFLILVILIGVIFIGYQVYIYIKYGILSSVSASYYKLREDGNKWLFIVFMVFLAVGLWLIASLNPHPMAWTFYLAGSGAAFVGIAAKYRDKMDEWVHIGGTYTLIFFSLLGLGLVFGLWWPTYSLIGSSAILVLLKNKINNYGYWSEELAFACFYSGLIFILI